MSIDKVTQAILLLTVFFNKKEVGKVKPLTPLEYGRFAAWLHTQRLSPADLLGDAESLLSSWSDPKKKITDERICELLGRGASMGFALEGWRKYGVWILSRGNHEYPQLMRKHLGDARPPILFGIGDKSLLNRRGIGFVGSRSIDESDAVFTRKLASTVIKQGHIVVSGGAKGIDQTAMEAALECGGEAVGVLADSLLKASTLRIYRDSIKDGRLVLISPFYPEAGFSVGNAMGRNKYIYTLSEAVVAVRSDFEKGGTWAGAVENQKKGWVPLLVRDVDSKGNRALIEQGAIPVGDDCDDIQALIASASTRATRTPEKPLLAGIGNDDSHDALLDAIESSSGDTRAKEPKIEDGEASTEGDLSESQVEGADRVSKDEGVDQPIEIEAIPSAIHTDNGEAPENSVEAFEVSTDYQHEALIQIQSDLKASSLAQYGEIFSLFTRVMVEIGRSEGNITPTSFEDRFPELPVSLVKKWLAELDENDLLVREGRKLSYTLPKPDLFKAQ